MTEGIRIVEQNIDIFKGGRLLRGEVVVKCECVNFDKFQWWFDTNHGKSRNWLNTNANLDHQQTLQHRLEIFLMIKWKKKNHKAKADHLTEENIDWIFKSNHLYKKHKL